MHAGALAPDAAAALPSSERRWRRTLQGRQWVALHISTTNLSLLAVRMSLNSSGE